MLRFAAPARSGFAQHCVLSISVGPLASLGCVDLYNALIKLRPEWEAETLKVVMTGSAEDGPEWQKHIGNKKQRRDLANQLTHPPRWMTWKSIWLFQALKITSMRQRRP